MGGSALRPAARCAPATAGCTPPTVRPRRVDRKARVAHRRAHPHLGDSHAVRSARPRTPRPRAGRPRADGRGLGPSPSAARELGTAQGRLRLPARRLDLHRAEQAVGQVPRPVERGAARRRRPDPRRVPHHRRQRPDLLRVHHAAVVQRGRRPVGAGVGGRRHGPAQYWHGPPRRRRDAHRADVRRDGFLAGPVAHSLLRHPARALFVGRRPVHRRGENVGDRLPAHRSPARRAAEAGRRAGASSRRRGHARSAVAPRPARARRSP